ncbi:MAG: O-antigen ligase family protein [Deltaproteobacteria bacterium]|jgi:O-antigen ligase|nr:O-antigen ligase family protein [Deltaproteobacteria bacterium]MBT4265784.1 O-antigen ligase family protein [Deltaproteobacteria bacterium]MBT4638333.1 O-antigen ligase family protein [Deltaproteobacteria bacterium]MBT6504193.1 O-antigen ligase family protein [Deltaproteobacteria bacterium]MBT6615905.1 O-antigen ligase family protein [Deltaproteobacteria bacterium]
MTNFLQKIKSEDIRSMFLLVLFISIPFSIAGDDFAVIGLYLVTFYRFIKKEESWSSAPIVYGMGVMLLGAFISSLLSGEILHSLSYFRNFWRLGLPFLIFFAFRNRPYDRFLKVLAVISSLIAIYAVIQFFTGLDVLRSKSLQEEYRAIQGVWYAVGIFSHHLTYGGVSLLLFALFLPNIFSQGRSRNERLLFTVATICNLAATGVCMGRSIWLGTLTAMGVMILVYLGWKRSLIFFSLLAMLVGGFWGYSSTQKDSLLKSTAVGRRILSITGESNPDRLFMWKASLQVIKDNPILGLGPMRRKEMEPYYVRITNKEKHQFQHRPTVGVHNIYLQNWIDFGLLGMLGYLIWWGTLFVQILSALRQGSKSLKVNAQLSGCLAGLCGIMVAGFFENNFRDGEVQITILLVMGLSLVLLDKHKTAA